MVHGSGRRPNLTLFHLAWIWKSISPKGSDRTMVGKFDPVAFQFSKRTLTLLMKLANASRAGPIRRSRRRCGWLPQHWFLCGGPSSGEHFLLTAPFIEPPRPCLRHGLPSSQGMGIIHRLLLARSVVREDRKSVV